MLWVKSLHIVFVTSWFAGLFYLPRIFVNLAMVAPQSVAERERLLLMAAKLLRFMGPMALLAMAFGLWLWLGCGVQLKKLRQGATPHSHTWYRWFNEVPVLMLLAAVILVVVKPF